MTCARRPITRADRLQNSASRQVLLTAMGPAAPIVLDPGPTTERVHLRHLTPDDRDAFLHAVRTSRDQLERFMPIHRPGESDNALFDRYLATTDAIDGDPGIWRRIAVLDDGRVAGALSIVGIRSTGVEPRGDVSWWIATPMAGQGLASACLARLADHTLADQPAGLGLCRLDAGIRRDNPASARVASKAGFRKLGESRTHLRTGERWVLHDMYARFASVNGGA